MTAAVADARNVQDVRGAGATGRFLVVPLIVLIMAQMGTSGDNFALSLATSKLTDALNASMGEVQLANTMYSLMAGAFMVAGGMLGAIIGWKRNFRVGTLLAACGEFVMAVSPNIFVFTWAGRLLVGFGASFLVPSILGLVPRIWKSDAHRAMAFGGVGAATGLAQFLPLVLGVLLDMAGFRVTFAVLGCYFLIVFAASFAFPPIERTGERLKLDGLGIALAGVGLFMFVIGISNISNWGLIEAFPAAPFSIAGISPALPLAAAGLVVLVVMLRLERGVEERNGCALLPQSFLKTPQVLAGLCASAMTFAFMGAQIILVTPYLQLVGGLTSLETAFVNLLYGVPMFLVSLGVPRFMGSVRPGRILTAGYVLMAVSIVPMALSVEPSGISMPMLSVSYVLAGVALGAVASQASTVVALAINDRDAAQSGGVQATCRNVGQAISVALLGTVLLFGITSGVSSGAATSEVVSPTVAEQIAGRNLTLSSDEEFIAEIADIPMTDAERGELLDLNAQSRVASTRIAFCIMGVICLAGVLTTRWITVTPQDAGDIRA